MLPALTELLETFRSLLERKEKSKQSHLVRNIQFQIGLNGNDMLPYFNLSNGNNEEALNANKNRR